MIDDNDKTLIDHTVSNISDVFGKRYDNVESKKDDDVYWYAEYVKYEGMHGLKNWDRSDLVKLHDNNSYHIFFNGLVTVGALALNRGQQLPGSGPEVDALKKKLQERSDYAINALKTILPDHYVNNGTGVQGFLDDLISVVKEVKARDKGTPQNHTATTSFIEVPRELDQQDALAVLNAHGVKLHAAPAIDPALNTILLNMKAAKDVTRAA